MERRSRSEVSKEVMHSRRVQSNQRTLHPRLCSVIKRQRLGQCLRPVAAHSLCTLEPIFNSLLAQNNPVIFDLGCGTAESSIHLARCNPDHTVVGVDKSRHRLSKSHAQEKPANLILAHADVRDCIQLLALHPLSICAIFFLFPNPWPKKKHLQRRWHCDPSFDTLTTLDCYIELRTNWSIYAREFAFALQVYFQDDILSSEYVPAQPISAFERKYNSSGHPLYRVRRMPSSKTAILEIPV